MTDYALDALVAEKVMGYKPCDLALPSRDRPLPMFTVETTGRVCLWDSREQECFKYGDFSASGDRMLEVLEKMRSLGWNPCLLFLPGQNLWHASFGKDDLYPIAEQADTAARAVCRAAVKALTIKFSQPVQFGVAAGEHTGSLTMGGAPRKFDPTDCVCGHGPNTNPKHGPDGSFCQPGIFMHDGCECRQYRPRGV